MIDRRRAIRLALAALPAAWLLRPTVARAQQAFQRLLPFLVDLPGWSGSKADGMAMDMPGVSMVTATREYKRGDATLNVQLITGPAAQGTLGAIQSGIKLETGDMHMSTATVDGLTVARTFMVHDKSGTVLVALGANALFNLAFKGVAEDEAFALARRFDWKAIQAALPK